MTGLIRHPAGICADADSRSPGQPSLHSPFLMAHYMPWFAARPARHEWGWHWTMNHFRPERVTAGGRRREAASHYYPLIGLYDSGDPDALECHVHLMKLAGIDGVILDWYGTEEFLDYGLIHRNALRLIPILKRAGLRFAVCYEDQTVAKLIAAGRLPEAEALAHGRRLLCWLQAHWFSDPAYLRLGGRPALLVFGPQYYRDGQWDRIFAGLAPRPQLLTLQDRQVMVAVGGFGWPEPGGGTQKSFTALDGYYARARGWPLSVPAAYPRFHDIYREAGVGPSFGRIDDQGGRTYAQTLGRALESGAPVVQLVTWNDWGEGTMLEPSMEFGYRDLETTQRLRRKHIGSSFRYAAEDLRLPVRLYRLRKQHRENPGALTRLGAASRALLAGEPDRARALLREPR